ncbi:MAG: hypothetical protein ABID38_07230 [Candidatus Diapherotrites archaeon]
MALIVSLILFAGCTASSQKMDENAGCGDEICEIGNETPPENFENAEPVIGPQETEITIALSISTDKESYGSNEEIIIIVTATASKNVENALVKVWGITPGTKNYIEAEETVTLNQGENEIEFIGQTPFCTKGCGGVYPGPYSLHASVEINGEEMAKAETTIELVSD